jgi:hypothetical protein
VAKEISAINKMFKKNITFPEGFFLNRMNKAVFVITLWGSLKNFKIRSASYSALDYKCKKN